MFLNFLSHLQKIRAVARYCIVIGGALSMVEKLFHESNLSAEPLTANWLQRLCILRLADFETHLSHVCERIYETKIEIQH